MRNRELSVQLKAALAEVGRLRGSIGRLLESVGHAEGHDARLLLIDVRRWLERLVQHQPEPTSRSPDRTTADIQRLADVCADYYERNGTWPLWATEQLVTLLRAGKP